MREIKNIVIHCTATPSEWSWKRLQHLFLHQFGWSREGYHVVIEKDGKVKRLIPNWKYSNGTRPFQKGSFRVSNSNSVHIAWMGGNEGKQNITNSQMESLKAVCDWYYDFYPEAVFMGHNQIDLKLCPILNIPMLLQSWNYTDDRIYFGDTFNVLKWHFDGSLTKVR